MAPAEERFTTAPAPASGEGTSPAAAPPTEPANSPSSPEGSNESQKCDPVQQTLQQETPLASSSSASPATASPPPPPPSASLPGTGATAPGAAASSSAAQPQPLASSHSSSSSSLSPPAAPPQEERQPQASLSPASGCDAAAPPAVPPVASQPQPPPPPPPAQGSSSSSQPRKQTTPPPRIVYDLPPENNKSTALLPFGNGDSSGSAPVRSSCSASMAEGDEDGAVGRRCCLDAADSHIDLDISPDGLRATCLHTDGFQYTWKGVRSTYGVRGTSSQYYFEVKVVGSPSVVMPETPPATQNVCRIGVSQPFTSLFLGESGESWGYGGTAKKSHARKFENYGQPYGLHDVVGVIIDLQNLKLSFLKNGVFLGTAYTLPARVRDTGLFPHLYLKNVDVQVNFRSATAWFPPPNKEIRFIGDLPPQALLENGVEHPRHVGECEFIMMVGLPACGKTFWAERHCMRHPTKSYVLLGTNAVIDQMRVMGVRRQANYASRWEELMTTATAIFNALVARAGTGKNPRNVIIDQTNVYRNARRRKVQPFLAWGVRRAVTIVNDEQTLQQRTHKREQEEGKFVPVAAVKEMQAAFCLPHLDDGFTVIEYPELPEMESRQQVRWYNEDGRRFKRENPNAMGNQTKPHMEKRRPEEFVAAGELYPEKKRGRFAEDDPQQRQQPYGAGGGCGPGAAGGGWPGAAAAGGRRGGECYGGDGGGAAAGGGGQGRGQQQHQWQQQQQQQHGGGYGGGRNVQQQQQDYYYPSPRGYQQQQQQPWGWQQQDPQQDSSRGGGGPRPRPSNGGGTAGYYEAEGHSSNGRDYSSPPFLGDGGQRTYAAGGRGGGGGAGGYPMHAASGGAENYYGEARGRSSRAVYHQQQQAEGYFDGGGGAGGDGGRGGRSYYVESSPSFFHGRPGAGSTGEPLGGGGRGDAQGYYAVGSAAAGSAYASWPDASAGGGGMYAGNARSSGGSGGMHQQQRQAWGPGRHRGGGGLGGNPAAGGGPPGRRY